MKRTTSFGTLEILHEINGQPKIEHLVFKTSGRKHRHPYFETFVILKGHGYVFSGANKITVAPGDVVTIPPNTTHWMEPEPPDTLEGFLWCHDEPINLKTSTS